MKYRIFGKTGLNISEVSLGTWQLGARWGDKFDFDIADRILNTAFDNGVNFFDTADVYNDGLSEKAIGKFIKGKKERPYIASKCGRQIDPHVNSGYTVKVLRKYVEATLMNMGIDCLDLIQLHCPPVEVYYRPEIFGLFDDLKKEGKIGFLGVSVEKVEEALKAIEYDNVCTVQIIFNMFRHRPSELFFREAKKKNIGIIARVPLASGLLSGKITSSTTFGKDDHRTFNRNGEAFDKGETFSGINFDLGLKAVEELKKIFPADTSLALWALRWILMFDEVSCVIPGASKEEHIHSNVKASGLPGLTKEQMDGVNRVYNEYIKDAVHHLW